MLLTTSVKSEDTSLPTVMLAMTYEHKEQYIIIIDTSGMLLYGAYVYLLHGISLAIANGAAKLLAQLVVLALAGGGEELGVVAGLLASDGSK